MDIAALTGILIGCALMAGTIALTTWRVDAVARRGGATDDYFWVVFGGLAAATGVGVLAGTAGVLGALLAVGVGVGSVVVAAAWVVRRHRRRRVAAAEAAWTGLRRRHDAAVQRWTDYDVDPAKAIDHPGMHDPSSPAVRPIVRALRSARSERGDAEKLTGVQQEPPRSYAVAVGELERAIDAAEQALGVSGPPRPPTSGGHRADLESLPAGRFRQARGS